MKSAGLAMFFLLTLGLSAATNDARWIETARIGTAEPPVTDAIALAEARAKADTRSEFGMELRPRISDDDVGAALRVYLPSRWSGNNLRERLALVAEEERLRIAALEWEELMAVYRGIVEYRSVRKTLAILEQRLARLEPWLSRVDEAVERNQFPAAERARIYALYLEWINQRDEARFDLTNARDDLRARLGADLDWAAVENVALFEKPRKDDLNRLLAVATRNRSDFLALDTEARAWAAAEKVAREEDGFRLKYLQPDFRVDHGNGEFSYGLTASFTLPWGTRDPDIGVYQRERALTLSRMDVERELISARLRAILSTLAEIEDAREARREEIARAERVLNQDLVAMERNLPLELRVVMNLRERLSDVELNDARLERMEQNALLDLIMELGTLDPSRY